MVHSIDAAVPGLKAHEIRLDKNEAKAGKSNHGRPTFSDVLGQSARGTEINPAGRTKGWAKHLTDAVPASENTTNPVTEEI